HVRSPPRRRCRRKKWADRVPSNGGRAPFSRPRPAARHFQPRGPPVFQPKQILHPTDLSSESQAAYAVAADLARHYGGRLLVLHVAETLGPENVTFGEVATQREPDGYRGRLLADLEAHVPPAGLPVEYVLAEGDPATEIVRVARERGCDVIVMATHGL